MFGSGAPSDIEAEAAGVFKAAEWISVGAENDSPARELGRSVVLVAQNAYTGMKRVAFEYRLDRFLRSGDHISLLQSGFLSSVRFTEPNENFKHQHRMFASRTVCSMKICLNLSTLSLRRELEKSI